MKKLQHTLLLTALLTASLGASAAGVVTGTEQTVTRNLVVSGTAVATVSITPVSNTLAGVNSGGQRLATWQASTTGGTIAFRFNPTIVQQYTTPLYGAGYIKNSADATKRIEIQLTLVCSNNGVAVGTVSTLSGQWRLCPEGSESVSGNIQTVNSKVQTLTGGIYPVAVDAVAWTN